MRKHDVKIQLITVNPSKSKGNTVGSFVSVDSRRRSAVADLQNPLTTDPKGESFFKHKKAKTLAFAFKNQKESLALVERILK